jgi:polyferredoxin
MMGKIIGPLFIGRSWCSWGCWTLMVLDLLPFKESRGWKKGNLKKLKYLHFIISLGIVIALVFGAKYFLHDPNLSPEQPGTYRALYWFLIGNLFYFISGIILAIVLKENRAFCKYLCPVSLFLKLSNLVSVLRIKGAKEKCTKCNACVKKCLFNIDIPGYIEQDLRVKSSECVMCMKCIASCPEGALKASVGFDIVTKDNLKEY